MDNVVVIDDSIVRGTTLKQSIIAMLDRLHPRKIVVVSSSPQVRYPDYYGIDMSRMSEFIAFRAAIELLKERGMSYVIHEVYERCKKQVELPAGEQVNEVKAIYAPFTDKDISDKMVEMEPRPKWKSFTRLSKGCTKQCRLVPATGISRVIIQLPAAIVWST